MDSLWDIFASSKPVQTINQSFGKPSTSNNNTTMNTKQSSKVLNKQHGLSNDNNNINKRQRPALENITNQSTNQVHLAAGKYGMGGHASKKEKKTSGNNNNKPTDSKSRRSSLNSRRKRTKTTSTSSSSTTTLVNAVFIPRNNNNTTSSMDLATPSSTPLEGNSTKRSQNKDLIAFASGKFFFY